MWRLVIVHRASPNWAMLPPRSNTFALKALVEETLKASESCVPTSRSPIACTLTLSKCVVANTCEEEGFTRDYHAFPSNNTRDDPPITRDYHAFPSSITRDGPPITRDDTPFFLTLQGMALQLQGIDPPPF